MKIFYSEYDRHLVAIDCIIFGFDGGELKLLLHKRRIEPAFGEWSLMGGFLNKSESLSEGACRILNQHTGLSGVFMEQLYTFGEVTRDSGARTISVAFFSLIKIDENCRTLAKDHGAEWIPINNLPELIFDHSTMVKKALIELRRKATHEPIGFKLLPVKFTLPQLHSLYESIYQDKLDRRNFRKQILVTGLLLKLDEKDKDSSRKGAYYYKFDHQKYTKYSEQGFLFRFKKEKEHFVNGNTGNLIKIHLK